ncbi:hypothetical protein GC194_04045 [bacterium]|nr:hypothetical protein [bacterium]
MEQHSNGLREDDPNLLMARDLKKEGLSNMKIRKELEQNGLDEKYITAIIRAINPQYRTETKSVDRMEGGKSKFGMSPWKVIIFVLILLRLLIRLFRD